MYTPGYYKSNYRVLTLREMVRMGGLFRLPFTFLLTRFMSSSWPSWPVWMPGLWADTKCTKEELSEAFWRATASFREACQELGFMELNWSKATRHLDPRYRDSGSISYLHRDQSQMASAYYVQVQSPEPNGIVVERVTMAFTVVLPKGSMNYTNGKEAFDPLPGHDVIRISTTAPRLLYAQFQAHLRRLTERPIVFPDVDSIVRWFDSKQLAAFEHRVRRGLFIRMSDHEVEEARRNLPPS